MKDAFHEVVGKPINVKLTELSHEERKEQKDALKTAGLLNDQGEVTQGFDALIAKEGPYTSYEERLEKWFSHKPFFTR